MLFGYIKIAICYFVSFFSLSLLKAFRPELVEGKNLKLKTLLVLLTINFSLLTTNAQTYPVQINAQLVPPYSGYLPDYADPNAQNLKVFLQFNDFTVPSYNLKLKLEIKGNGFSLVTKAIYNPPPISLQPGQPILLSGADLAPYLTSNNLDFIGINQNQYEQRMALPEGYYSICITAYDYYSGTPVQVSNEACAQGWFILSNPPLLNLPLCNAVVTPLQPQNIFFNWTPVNLGSPNSSFNTSYLFELWEMRPDSTVNPNQLVQNTLPIFSQVITINSINYGITETPLNLYYKYAWRVKVIDGSGKDWFINNGYSQVCTFYYGSIANTLGDAVNLNLQAQAVDYVSGLATWTLQNFYNSYQLDVREVNTQDWTSYTTTINNQTLTNLAPGKTYECRVKGFGNAINGNFSNIASFTTPLPPTINLQTEALDYTSGRAFWAFQNSYNNYQLEVRKKNTPNWFPYTTTANSQVSDNLESNKTYECRVKGFGNNFNSEYSNIAEFTTPAPPSYNCNQAAPIYSNNATPLPYNKAVTGMTVKSGQFDVKIKFINPGTMGAGYYTGNGYAMMFGVLPIPVTFTNVFIDDKQRQQQGIIHAVTKGMKKWMQQFDIEDAEEIATYVEGTLDSVYINNGQYCYTTLQNPTPVCAPIDTTKLPLVIRDGDGNQYVVNAGPPPTVTGPTSYLNLSNDNLAATSTLMVQFAKATNQNFGFDSKEYPAFTEEYECIKLSNGKNYFVANKSIGNGVNQNDKVIATYTIQNFNAAQLSFKTKGGGVLTKTNVSNNSYEVTNIPPNADCIYAWYNGQKIGKLNIISLNKVSKKVVLVPVNGASVMGISQQGLNDIYKQANTIFTLTTAPNFTFDLGNDGLEAADAKLMSKYSAEMRALRDAYKKKDSLYNKNAYYMFVVPNFSNPQLQGYMVRGRAVGFIKTGATVNDVAHELGHGAFKLEHTFDAIAKGSSNNLMDYSNNIHLTKSQWLNIQNPTNELTWFDGEEDGSLFNADDYFKQVYYNPLGKKQYTHKDAVCYQNDNDYTIAFSLPTGETFCWVNDGMWQGYFIDGIKENHKSYLFFVEDKYNRVSQPISWGIYLSAYDLGGFALHFVDDPKGTVKAFATGIKKIVTLDFNLNKTWDRVCNADLTDASYVLATVSMAYLAGPSGKGTIVEKEVAPLIDELEISIAKSVTPKLTWAQVIANFKLGNDFGKRITNLIGANNTAYLTEVAQKVGITLQELQTYTKLKELQLNLAGGGYVILDNVWAKTVTINGQLVKEIIVNENKLAALTKLSKRQTQFLNEISSNPNFSIRSTLPEFELIAPKNSIVRIKSFIKTAGDGTVNGSYTITKLK